MKKNGFFKFILIYELIITAVSAVMGGFFFHLFYESDKYWDNGPLPGYEEAAAALDICNNFRGTFTLLFLFINVILGIIAFIRVIAKSIVKRSTTGEALYGIFAWLFTIVFNVLIIFMYLLVQIFTYGMGV